MATANASMANMAWPIMRPMTPAANRKYVIATFMSTVNIERILTCRSIKSTATVRQ